MIRERLQMLFFANKQNGDFKKVKELSKNKGKLKHNIYGEKDPKKYSKKFLLVHFFLKYRLIDPVLKLSDKLFGNIKIKKIPNTEHNYLLKSFDRGFEQGIRKWFKFQQSQGRYNGLNKSYITKLLNKRGSVKRVRSMKEWLLTVLLMDTAYKELFNMILLEVTKEVNKQFKTSKAKHLIYTSHAIDDVEYLSIFKQVREESFLIKHKNSEV